MKHLTEEQLSARLDGALVGRAAEQAERHLADCVPCREALAELAAQDRALRPALAHDPGDAYFGDFASRVEQRVATAATTRTRAGAGFDMGRYFRGPRALAWAGGIAVVVVGGGLALMTGRDVIPPDLRDHALVGRLDRPAPSAARPSPRTESPAPPPAPAAPIADAAPPEGALGAGGSTLGEESGTRASASLDEREAGAVQRPEPTRPVSGATLAKERVATPAGNDAAFARPPAEEKLRADALAPLPVPAPSEPSSAPADARQAIPGRAREVRRNEAGEDLPVRRETARQPVAPVPFSSPGFAEKPGQIRKKQLAEPLEADRKSATLNSLDAREERADVQLCGDVRDVSGRPVAGAQVVLADLGRNATTDASGRFCLAAPRGEHALTVMAIGYATARQTVTVAGDAATARLTLAAVPVLERPGLTPAGRAGTRAPVTEVSDEFSALADSLRQPVREAQRLVAEAATRRSAAQYDRAAAAWERAHRHLAERPEELAVLRELAAARFRAWELAPDSRRSRAAFGALTHYIGRAPAGADRDQAARWLNQVRP